MKSLIWRTSVIIVGVAAVIAFGGSAGTVGDPLDCVTGPATTRCPQAAGHIGSVVGVSRPRGPVPSSPVQVTPCASAAPEPSTSRAGEDGAASTATASATATTPAGPPRRTHNDCFRSRRRRMLTIAATETPLAPPPTTGCPPWLQYC